MESATLRPKKHNPVTAFIAAWLGWCFDGLDGYLYVLVALPFVKELLGPEATIEKVAGTAALIQACFLVGWAVGGAFFGRIGDKIGRTKTLTLTILTFALFTGLSFFATAWWHLLIFRFLAALGIGGEWAAGSALVAETFRGKGRPWASALLQSGYMTGMILAAVSVGLLSHLPYRYVFLVGVIPALLTIPLRWAVPEPEEWAEHRNSREMPKISALFDPEVRGTTWRVLAICSLTLTCVWAFLYFNNPILRGLESVKGMPKAQQDILTRSVTVEYTLWTIAGNFFAAAVATFFGYRKAFVTLVAGAFVVFVMGYRQITDLASARLWFNLTGFFATGVFALYPLYIPPLFPTLLRTTGAGFCYNFGRLISAVGVLLGGALSAQVGGPAMAVWYVGFLYIFAFIVALTLPEPDSRPAQV